MKNLVTILGGIGFLIGMFLVLSNGDKSVKIIETIATNSTQGIKTLQGR